MGQDVILGVRPETIARYQHGTNLLPNFALAGPGQRDGADRRRYPDLSGPRRPRRHRPRPAVPAPNAGEVAEFTVDMGRACLFDPKTEQRGGVTPLLRLKSPRRFIGGFFIGTVAGAPIIFTGAPVGRVGIFFPNSVIFPIGFNHRQTLIKIITILFLPELSANPCFAENRVFLKIICFIFIFLIIVLQHP